MVIMAYARVSGTDQNEGRQMEKFKSLEMDDRYIFVDKQSGKDFNRPRYLAMKAQIRQGDLVYIDSLDRLGRNYDEVIKEWRVITRELQADIVILDNESLFDSRKFKSMGDMGKLLEDQMLSLLSYVAEQERKRILQRQREGINLALAEGRPYGRPKEFKVDSKFKEVYQQWKDKKILAVQAMKLLGLNKTTFYKLVKELEQQTAAK